MSRDIDTLIPSAKEVMQQAATKDAERASERARLTAVADAEKKALID